MINYFKTQTLYILKVATALAPCFISMYLLFWLGKHEVWLPETPHRDKITIIIVAMGLALSFIIYSYFDKHKK